MSNPTRQEILDAQEELEKLCERLPRTRQAKMTIPKALPPKPKPTVAEIDWDDDDHFLAEAEHDHFGKVIMVHECEYSGEINILVDKRDMTNRRFVRPETLTPTGRRYTLTEVQE